MSKRVKRIWTDEQRAAAADRMRHAGQVRVERLRQAREQSQAAMPVAVAERDPEVQAVIDGMTPERRARLQQIQGQVLSSPDGQRALARHEAEKVAVLEPAGERNPVADLAPERERVGSREVRLIVKTDGTMVSCDGPCICGAAKREWHKVCLAREVAHVA